MHRSAVKILICALCMLLPAAAAWADGAVYAMTNALGNNQVLVYHRASDGTLTLVQTIATGGGGSGLQLTKVDSLGSAGGVQLDPDHRLLFVVNTETAAENNGAGAYNSDCNEGTITAFHVAADGTLKFADRAASGGLFPNSLTVRRRNQGQDGDVLYVLNAGGPGIPACKTKPHIVGSPNITGFHVNKHGHLLPFGSTQPIDPGPASGTGENCSAASASGFAALTGAPAADFQCGLNPPSFPRSPAQVRFTPNGAHLVVTVKGTNTIYVFPVGENEKGNTPDIVQATPPALPTFSGLAFDTMGRLLVTELFGSATTIPAGGAGAVSSFTIASDGDLLPISSHVDDGGTAPCCIALEPTTGKFAFVANNLSASLSSYTVASDGSVTLLNAIAAAGAGPNDLAVASEGGASFLYVVEAGTGTVGAFQIDPTTGSLTAITGGGGLPTSAAQGLAAF